LPAIFSRIIDAIGSTPCAPKPICRILDRHGDGLLLARLDDLLDFHAVDREPVLCGEWIVHLDGERFVAAFEIIISPSMVDSSPWTCGV
jgi:hypothetical protein